jgi:CcmD family protein
MSLLAAVSELPALPLHEAGKYVAGAYIVLFVLVLVYVAIMAVRLSRIERELGELLELSARAPLDEELDVGRPESSTT